MDSFIGAARGLPAAFAALLSREAHDQEGGKQQPGGKQQAGCAQQQAELRVRRSGCVGFKKIPVDTEFSEQIDDEEHRQLLQDAAGCLNPEPDKGALQRHMALVAHVACAGLCGNDAAEDPGEHEPDQVGGLRRDNQQEGHRR